MGIDDLDRRILEELLKNSKRSYRQLADELEIAPGTVLKRIKDMESSGIIKSYSIMIDHNKIGSQIIALVEIISSGGKLEEMGKKLSKLPNIYGVYETTGSPDAIIIGRFRDTDELGKFARFLLGLPSVSRTNTHVVLNTVKEDFRILL
ncbi:MAG TPA: Lrp/AsnC family transcriptional regulator [Candidatus Nitrosotalea sp.]|nr:Lrp/AsnC family transcriptional regulator [Nitrososphaerota archaeon]HKU32754.1 Lrp/AsnC family transcriptional regulator [Candidatus Nitrosotalea sp.]